MIVGLGLGSCRYLDFLRCYLFLNFCCTPTCCLANGFPIIINLFTTEKTIPMHLMTGNFHHHHIYRCIYVALVISKSQMLRSFTPKVNFCLAVVADNNRYCPSPSFSSSRCESGVFGRSFVVSSCFKHHLLCTPSRGGPISLGRDHFLYFSSMFYDPAKYEG